MIFSGWKQINGIWYFFNTVHDGTFGSALVSKWQWIDGYCYLFDAEGKMYANTTTPDGFVVNADGQWMENGKAVYVSGKGIITKSPGGSATGQTATVKRSSGGIIPMWYVMWIQKVTFWPPRKGKRSAIPSLP